MTSRSKTKRGRPLVFLCMLALAWVIGRATVLAVGGEVAEASPSVAVSKMPAASERLPVSPMVPD